MDYFNFFNQHINEFQNRNISFENFKAQAELLEKGKTYKSLHSPCTIGNGIIELYQFGDSFDEKFNQFIRFNRLTKFVPASGAASRMFKSIIRVLNEKLDLKNTNHTDSDIITTVHFINHLHKFPFYDTIKHEFATHNLLEINQLPIDTIFAILEFILSPKGLNFENTPKALIKFHKDEQKAIAALELQILEYIEITGFSNNDIPINLHFTISDEHLEECRITLQEYLENELINISFTTQDKSTDTISLDSKSNEILTDINNNVVFRPGGHGSLIHNLDSIQSDYILIKNIDNINGSFIYPEAINELRQFILTGYEIDRKIKSFIAKLKSNPDEPILSNIIEYICNTLRLSQIITSNYSSYGINEKTSYLISLLNRPFRLCAVVKNTGEPGGGPFFVEKENGRLNPEIVEFAEIDLKIEQQANITKNSTHFNPVLLFCSTKNEKNQKYNLTEYVNQNDSFISNKSYRGRDIKIIEHPGLWNGSMGGWFTVFVNVSSNLFTPVKEVNDLLKY